MAKVSITQEPMFTITLNLREATDLRDILGDIPANEHCLEAFYDDLDNEISNLEDSE